MGCCVSAATRSSAYEVSPSSSCCSRGGFRRLLQAHYEGFLKQHCTLGPQLTTEAGPALPQAFIRYCLLHADPGDACVLESCRLVLIEVAFDLCQAINIRAGENLTIVLGPDAASFAVRGVRLDTWPCKSGLLFP